MCEYNLKIAYESTFYYSDIVSASETGQFSSCFQKILLYIFIWFLAVSSYATYDEILSLFKREEKECLKEAFLSSLPIEQNVFMVSKLQK